MKELMCVKCSLFESEENLNSFQTRKGVPGCGLQAGVSPRWLLCFDHASRSGQSPEWKRVYFLLFQLYFFIISHILTEPQFFTWLIIQTFPEVLFPFSPSNEQIPFYINTLKCIQGFLYNSVQWPPTIRNWWTVWLISSISFFSIPLQKVFYWCVTNLRCSFVILF